MTHLKGRTALLTGADGGMGGHLATALAAEGVNLLLVGFEEHGLAALVDALTARGVCAKSIHADLRDASQRRDVVAAARREFGDIDLLVNNAGVEYSCPYHELTPAQIKDVIEVNLTASMMLAHLVLPDMLRRRSGHIVNMSSLAGKSGPAFQEPYAATKAALTAFTYSLRATYRSTGVSASVITPGFVDTGIYARLKDRTHCTAPFLLSPVSPDRVARALLRAIRYDLPEVLVSRYPVQPILMILALMPRLGLWMIARLGTHEFFRRVVEASKREPGVSSGST